MSQHRLNTNNFSHIFASKRAREEAQEKMLFFDIVMKFNVMSK